MKTSKTLMAVAIMASFVFAAGSALAATANGTATLSAKIGTKATLSLGGSTAITFDDTGDTTSVANITAPSATTVSALYRTAKGNKATLTVTPDKSVFTSGTATIPVSAVSWASAAPLAAGSFSGTTAIKLDDDSWTDSGSKSGNMTYTFANDLAYTAGTYDTVTINYVLSAP
jgi:hypothetical protein